MCNLCDKTSFHDELLRLRGQFDRIGTWPRGSFEHRHRDDQHLVATLRRSRTRDDGVVVLAPRTTHAFSNVTDALSPRTVERDWAVTELPESECQAIVLCTDGISDDLEDVDGFMRGLVRSVAGLAQVSASRRARRLLDVWPVPRHQDDKTIACLYRDVIDA